MQPEPGASPAEATLALLQVDHVWFDDETYRWIDMSTFALGQDENVVDPRKALARLLSHDHHYVNRYDVADNHPTHLSREAQAREGMQPWLAAAASHPNDPTPARMAEQLQASSRQSYTQKPPSTHGPYLMSAISLNSFDRLTGSQARQTLETWIDGNGDDAPSAEQIRGDLSAVLEHLDRSTLAFHLHDLGETAQHDYGYTVDPFIELITIDLAQRSIVLIAGGGD